MLSKRWNESNEFDSSEQTTTTSWNQASLMKRVTAMSAVLQVILAFACCNNGARSTLVEAKHGRIPQGRVFDRAEWLIRDVVISGLDQLKHISRKHENKLNHDLLLFCITV
jgi:hypothetical protein